MFLNRFAKGTEDDPLFAELLFKGRADRDAIKHGVHCDASEALTFFERNAELLVGLDQLGINLVETFRAIGAFFGR